MSEIKRSREQIYKYTNSSSYKSMNQENLISGYASVFGIADQHKDIIKSGAFKKSVEDFSKGKTIPLLWQHMQDKPIGSIERIIEDEYGLYVVAKIIPTIRYGMEALELIKSRIVCGFSIGFNSLNHFFYYKQDARVIEEIDLWEISLVTFPANTSATITSF